MPDFGPDLYNFGHWGCQRFRRETIHDIKIKSKVTSMLGNWGQVRQSLIYYTPLSTAVRRIVVMTLHYINVIIHSFVFCYILWPLLTSKGRSWQLPTVSTWINNFIQHALYDSNRRANALAHDPHGPTVRLFPINHMSNVVIERHFLSL